jgi:hypothetical protein
VENLAFSGGLIQTEPTTFTPKAAVSDCRIFGSTSVARSVKEV